MPKYRNALPQLAGDKLFLSDGGLETDLIFLRGIDLPLFASISLYFDDDDPAVLGDYFTPYIEAAKKRGTGMIVESATWRSSPDWLDQLNVPADRHEALNRAAIQSLVNVRTKHETKDSPIVISALLGPRGDGYTIDTKMSVEEATAYHSWQANLFADTEADLLTVATMNYVEEAIGVALAGKAAGLPTVIGFTVETDGRLPSGQPLGEAINQVDEVTGNYPVYYMINCAHPDHFATTLANGDAWVSRIRALRANASRMSHAELDNAAELDDGDPREFGVMYADLRAKYPSFVVFGGCCGTDHRHITEVANACA